MTYYIQRRDGGKVETIDEIDDRREAYKVVREYNISDQSAFHYVSIRACKSWANR